MKKYFIITVDTEPDGQWDINALETTENAKYIERFQLLCNKYGFKPVYLTDYVMLNDHFYINMIKKYLKRNECEIGMHLHAWDTPPFCELDKMRGNRPYLIEYSDEMMEQKIKSITTKLHNIFDEDIVSHRAGRWALDKRYAKLLEKYGFKIDCSVTPNINWEKTEGRTKGSKGTDYTLYPEDSFYLFNTNVLEVPMTVKKINNVNSLRLYNFNIKQVLKKMILGNKIWFRPALFTQLELEYLYEITKDNQYIEMMIHSSELMPGGSPYFPDEKSIEDLYAKLENLFLLINKTHEGLTLKDFYYNDISRLGRYGYDNKKR